MPTISYCFSHNSNEIEDYKQFRFQQNNVPGIMSKTKKVVALTCQKNISTDFLWTTIFQSNKYFSTEDNNLSVEAMKTN